MAMEQFCLKWNDHQNVLLNNVDRLLQKDCFVDCTIAAEGQFIGAHKLVLSACSPYFEALLRHHREKHPIFILKDIKFEEVKAIMAYMYRGEVVIPYDKLAELLRAAESLQVKGLGDKNAGKSSEVNGLPQQQQITPNRPTQSPVIQVRSGGSGDLRRNSPASAEIVDLTDEPQRPRVQRPLGHQRSSPYIPRKYNRKLDYQTRVIQKNVPAQNSNSPGSTVLHSVPQPVTPQNITIAKVNPQQTSNYAPGPVQYAPQANSPSTNKQPIVQHVTSLAPGYQKEASASPNVINFTSPPAASTHVQKTQNVQAVRRTVPSGAIQMQQRSSPLQQASGEGDQIQQSQVHPTHMQNIQVQKSQVQQSQIHPIQVQKSQVQQSQIQKSQVQQSQIHTTQVQKSQVQQSQIHPIQVQKSQVQQSQIHTPQVQQSQVQQSQIHTPQVQQLQVQQSQIHTTQVQQSTVQPSQIHTTQVQQSTVQPSQIHTTQVQQSTVQPSQIHTTQVQQSTVQPSQIHTTQVQQSTVQPSQIQNTKMQESQVQKSQEQNVDVQPPDEHYPLQTESPQVQSSLEETLLSQESMQQDIAMESSEFSTKPQNDSLPVIENSMSIPTDDSLMNLSLDLESSNVYFDTDENSNDTSHISEDQPPDQNTKSNEGVNIPPKSIKAKRGRPVRPGIDRPFKCPDCGKLFTQKSSMEKHRKIHSEECLKCDICDKSFMGRSALIRHLRMHKNKNANKCELCGMMFSSAKALEDHLTLHAGPSSATDQ